MDKRDISKEKVSEIKKHIEYFGENGFHSLTCKEYFYSRIEDSNNELNIEEVSGCYVCHNPIKPRECDGYLEKAKNQDKAIITQMWYDDCVEANPEDHISYELAEKFADRFLELNTFYVWRNNDGKIVSMIDYTIVDDHAEVAHAYTLPEERGKGYMANSVYELTKITIKEGLTPVLSTDYNYVPSNKCYQGLGYQLEDKLVVISNDLKLKKDHGKIK